MDLLEVSGCQNDNPSFRKAKSSFKVTKNGVRLVASDWENLSLKNACALVFSGRRALDAGARPFPGVCLELPRGFQKPPKYQNLAPKGSRSGFGPKLPFPNSPRRRFYLPAWTPANCQNLAPKGSSRPGFGRKRPLSNGHRRRFYLPAGKTANCQTLAPKSSANCHKLAPKGRQQVKPVF